MSAILIRDKMIPDCFSCGACTEVCPTKSITFSYGKRSFPPAGKFLTKDNVDTQIVLENTTE
jgi:ferredoxin